jgi:hypothetical protein
LSAEAAGSDSEPGITERRAGIAATIVAILLILASTWLAFDASRRIGACVDEGKHVVVGYGMFTEGEFRGDDNTPITAIYGLPLLGTGFELPERMYLEGAIAPIRTIHGEGAKFFERYGLWPVLDRARLGAVFLWLVILTLIFVEGRRRGGPVGAMIAVGLAGFCPSLLAHAAILSVDLPLCFGVLVMLMTWRAYLTAPTTARAVLVGLGVATVVLSKLTGVVIAGAMLLDLLLRCRNREFPLRQVIAHSALAIAVATTTIVAAYLGDARAPVTGFLAASHYGEKILDGYFAGEYPSDSLWFYPVVLLVKAKPLALLLGLLGVVAMIRLRALRGAIWRAEGLAALLLFAGVMASRYNVGIRFLLPLLVLFALQAAVLGRLAPALPRLLVAAVLLAAHVVPTLRLHPDHLSYFNDFAGGPREGSWWFAESNSDWGQDVRPFAAMLREEGVEQVVGLLFGSVDPALYGFEYRTLLARYQAFVGLDLERKTLLAISASYYYAGLTSPATVGAKRWLDANPPDFLVGNTIRCWWLDEDRVASLLRDWSER